MSSLTAPQLEEAPLLPRKRGVSDVARTSSLKKRPCIADRSISERSQGRSLHRDALPPSPRAGAAAQSSQTHRLPDFIKPLPPTMPSDYRAFLEEHDTLTLPSDPFARQLIQGYCDCVHPFIPLLDCDDLIALYDSDSRSKAVHCKSEERYSLLLLQAVFFAGSAFVDITTIHAMGYETRKAARRVLYERALLLYDFKYESDHVTIMQALLLFTLWVEDPADDRYTWYWMSAAESLVQSLSLPNLVQHLPTNGKRAKILRRLWWACFMRKTVLALTLRHPQGAEYADFPLDFLAASDFVISEPGRANMDLARAIPVSIELAKLCLCVNRILSIQSSLAIWSRYPMANVASNHVGLHPARLLMDEIAVCEAELSAWLRGLPKEVSTPSLDVDNRHADCQAVALVGRLTLRLTHSLAVSALYRPYVHPSSRDVKLAQLGNRDLQKVASLKLRESAADVSKIAADLVSLDLTKYLPSYTIAVFFSVLIFQHVEAKSCAVQDRAALSRNVHLCKQVAIALGTRYEHAHTFMQALEPELARNAPPSSLRAAKEEQSLPAGWEFSEQPTDAQGEDSLAAGTSEFVLAGTSPQIDSQNAPFALTPAQQDHTGLHVAIQQHHFSVMPQVGNAAIDFEPDLDAGADLNSGDLNDPFQIPEAFFNNNGTELLEGLDRDLSGQWTSTWGSIWSSWEADIPFP